MAGRLPLVAATVLVVALAAWGWGPGAVLAQGPALAPQYLPQQYSAAPQGGYSPSAFVPPAYSGQPATQGGQPHAIRSSRSTYEELPDDVGWLYADTQLEKTLKDGFRHGYIRMEYLSWNITRPSNSVLAAPNVQNVNRGPSDVTNATGDRLGTDQISFLPGQNVRAPNTFSFINSPYGTTAVPIPQGLGYQPSLNSVGLNGTQGLRGTFGLPLASGAIETTVFFLQAAETNIENRVIGTAGSQTNLVYQPVQLNLAPVVSNATITTTITVGTTPVTVTAAGPPSNPFLLYDTNGTGNTNYTAAWRTMVWGAEGNYIFDAPNPNEILQFRPMLGFRYLNYHETLGQRGNYTFVDQGNASSSSQVLTRSIDSETNNNLFGPQVGVRAEVNSKYASFGFEPKAMVGINQYATNLHTSQIFAPVSAAQPNHDLRQNRATFGPILDLSAYSKIHLTEYFSLFVNYQFLYAGGITRPHTNIVYNATNTTPTGSAGNGLVSNFQDDFRLVPQFTNVVVQGITVGAELRY